MGVASDVIKRVNEGGKTDAIWIFVFDLGGVRNPALPSDVDALLISKRDWLNQKVGQIKAFIASQ